MTTGNSIPIFIADAFVSDLPCSGNPAAVCLIDTQQSAEWMQAVAAEIDLSETAFVKATGSSFELRWFTPVVEAELCGHATLAAAHILWQQGSIPDDHDLVFQSMGGSLKASKAGNSIELDFPATPESPCIPPAGLLDVLGIEATYVGKSRYDYMIVADSENSVRNLSPDMGKLRALGIPGVIVTCRSEGPEYDFISRYFDPGSGIDEDPVTGSAHCCLGPYWAHVLGRETLSAYQASPRGGVVGVRVSESRVFLRGSARTGSSRCIVPQGFKDFYSITDLEKCI
jgi:PhzF family phenazine biosynthesis protein